MITKEQYDAATRAKAEAQATIDQYFKEEHDTFTARLTSGVPFTDDELMYSANTLCPCGHGIAYPKKCGMNHYWDCSAILKGTHDKSAKHTGQLPFSFYDVKGESGAMTTRGVFKPKPTA